MKLTKNFKVLLAQSVEQYLHFCEIEARLIAKCPNLPAWFKGRSVEYYTGCKFTAQGTIESILHMHNIYKGFSEFTGKTINGIEYSYNLYQGLHDFYPQVTSN